MTDASNNQDRRVGYVGELGVKMPCRVAALVNIDLEGIQTVNGIALAEDDYILCAAQTDATENGPYQVSSGTWNRAVWFNNQLAAVPGTLIFTVEGSVNSKTLWQTVCDDNPIDFGTSEINFNFFATSGTGTFLFAANNLSDVANINTSRNNLNAQIASSILTILSTLTPGTNKIPYFPTISTTGVLDLVNLLNPVGSVIMHAANTPPSGYLECDGAAISRTTYANLFSTIGVVFGPGNGTTTFNIPDMRGCFPRGWANGGSIDSGRAFGSSQTDAFQGHKHTSTGANSVLTNNNNKGFFTGVGTSGGDTLQNIMDGGYATDGTNGSPRTATETRPVNIALMFCIKT